LDAVGKTCNIAFRAKLCKTADVCSIVDEHNDMFTFETVSTIVLVVIPCSCRPCK